MRKIILFLLFFNTLLHAQSTGDAAVQGASHWQNWTFAATAAVTATTAIMIVSMNDGNSVESTAH